jgi:hypothetical protein
MYECNLSHICVIKKCPFKEPHIHNDPNHPHNCDVASDCGATGRTVKCIMSD